MEIINKKIITIINKKRETDNFLGLYISVLKNRLSKLEAISKIDYLERKLKKFCPCGKASLEIELSNLRGNLADHEKGSNFLIEEQKKYTFVKNGEVIPAIENKIQLADRNMILNIGRNIYRLKHDFGVRIFSETAVIFRLKDILATNNDDSECQKLIDDLTKNSLFVPVGH